MTKLSLSICGNCGKDVGYQNIQKVIVSGYANLLCNTCKCCLEDEISAIAKRYLDKEIKNGLQR